MMARNFLAICLFFYIATVTSFALSVPNHNGQRVTDLAGVLSTQDRVQLEATLKSHELATSNQIAILLIPSLEGEDIEGYTNKVFNTWGLGQKGKDNGVLILVAVSDHKMRIEPGYGLEGALNDGRCGEIMDNSMVPRFKQNDYLTGLTAGVGKITQCIKGEYQVESNGNQTGGNQAESAGNPILYLALIAVFILSAFAKVAIGWFAGGLVGAVGSALAVNCWNGTPNEVFWALVIGFIVGALSTEILESKGSSGSGGNYYGGGGRSSSSSSSSSWSGGGGSSGGGGASRSW